MRFLSLCSGIEAASVAFKPLGWEPVAFAEIEPFPCAVLAHHYPDVPNLGDVTAIDGEQFKGRVDVVCFGFPCQDLSVAGKRKGLKDADGKSTRSGLFFDAMRIADASEARWVVVENVPGLFSSRKGQDFAVVVGEMAGVQLGVPADGWANSGVVLGPKGLVEWCVLDAQYFGLAQRRKRIFIVRDSGDWSAHGPILLDTESLSGNPAPRREAGERPAGSLAARAKGGGGFGTDLDCDGGVVAATLSGQPPSRRNGGSDPTAGHLIVGALQAGYGNGSEVHPERVGRDNQVFAVQERAVSESERSGPQGKGWQEGVGFTLEARNKVQAIAFKTDQEPEAHGDLCPTLQVPSRSGGGQPHAVAIPEVAWALKERDAKGADSDTKDGHLIPPATAVRRLTPTECARLQGFPDDYLNITYRGKPAADGPKYKALGNSWAVPCVRWIGARIQRAHKLLELGAPQ